MSHADLPLILHYLESEHEAAAFPGLAGAVLSAGEVAWAGGMGTARVGSDRPVDGGTLFLICSVSKLMVATLLQVAVARGLLGLDEPVVAHWPALAAFPGGERITARHLASHSAGLPLMPPLPELAITDTIPTLEALSAITMPDMARLLGTLGEMSPLAPPGEHYQYSNVGSAILAELLALKLGSPYPAAVARYILAPLGMEEATYDTGEIPPGRLSSGHFPFAGPPQPLPPYDLGAFLPAGGLYASARAMARFLRAQVAPPAGFLPLDALQAMWRPQLSLPEGRYGGDGAGAGIGLGWHLTTVDGQMVAEHGGADPGYAAFLAFMPATSSGIFLAANSGGDPQALADMAHEVLALLTG